MNEEIFDKVNELRELLREMVPTKNEEIPENEDLSKSKLDDLFDIDIFFSRKPGMRRSIQLISSNATKKEDIKVSCMTALCSLCDTMIANKQLNMNKEDIMIAFLGWMEQNNMNILDLR